ncbi:MAG: DUF2461 domain-containing protein, partial [Clostridiales bacterium]|nr:DUF2461 domain-containing protein [Clostridiales bacterium]
MYDYDGITMEALMLLEQNKFNNSKIFYEENKARINELAVKPLRQIAAIVSSELLKYDSLICNNPTKMVSRVRRDTRFTKDKTLYRGNLWVTFKRDKNDFFYAPAFWFEIKQNAYDYGMGFYQTSPHLMECYRKLILKKTDEFRKAIKKAEKAGFTISGESYKKNRDGDVPDDLLKYYNLKNMYAICSSPDLSKIKDEAIIDELK